MITSICPIFPSQNFTTTKAFYKPLGFRVTAEYEAEGYLILMCDSVELHFYRSDPIDPFRSNHSAFVRVDDANELSSEYEKLNLPKEEIPRVTLAEDKPWGICEFAIVDHDGNLLRVGHILD